MLVVVIGGAISVDLIISGIEILRGEPVMSKGTRELVFRVVGAINALAYYVFAHRYLEPRGDNGEQVSKEQDDQLESIG